ncbi:MAG: flavodoxin reductase [Planctomycetota bacterium]
MASSSDSDSSAPATGTDDWRQYAEHRGRVLHRETLATDVSAYIVEKPDGFDFTPGQAVRLAIDEEGWREEKRPFTITSLPSDPRLEFIVKHYPLDKHPGHKGMTERMGREVRVGDRLLFGDAWGAIEYRGPGVFLAGGAGVTPFIAILRRQAQLGEVAGNRLFFSNRRAGDVFLQAELFRTLGHSVTCTLTGEEHRDYEHGRIDRAWLESRVDDFSQPFYLCGPKQMVQDLSGVLTDLGADPDGLIFEGK